MAPSSITTPSTMSRIFAPELVRAAAGAATGWKTGGAGGVGFPACGGPPAMDAPQAVQKFPFTGAPQFEQKLAIFPLRFCGSPVRKEALLGMIITINGRRGVKGSLRCIPTKRAKRVEDNRQS